MADNDGFTLVKYKNPKHVKPSYQSKLLADSTSANLDDSNFQKKVLAITDNIESYKIELRSSFFYKNLMKSILESFDRYLDLEVGDSVAPGDGKLSELFPDFVCYGIGKLSESRIARYQFALFVLLWEHLRPRGQCYIYDPVFNCLDKQIIGKFGLVLISENEEAKRKVFQKTLFFVPHGGKLLYNNILWANWGLTLTNVILIGNSFSSYHERIPSGQLYLEAEYIARVLPFTCEARFPTEFTHDDIFNDLSIHYFLADVIQGQPSSFWEDHKEPIYKDDNAEIVLNTIP